MRPVCHPHGHVFDIFISAKSNDITIFLQSPFLYRKLRGPPYAILLCPLNILK